MDRETAESVGFDSDDLEGVSFDESSETEETEQSEEVESDDVESQEGADEEGEEDEGNEEGENPKEETPIEEDSEMDDSKFLDAINKLGAVSGDQPINIESKEQLLGYIQDGFNIKAERQSFDSEKEEAIQNYNKEVESFESQMAQFSESIEKLNKFDFALQRIEKEDPTLFEEIQEYVGDSEQNFNNPYVKQLESKIGQLEKIVNQINENTTQSTSREQEKIQLGALQKEMEPLVNATGLKADWDKVVEFKNRDSSGQMSLKQAFNALYADKIISLKDSKKKVESTKRTVAGKTKPRTIGTGTGKKDGAKTKLDFGKMSHDEAFDAIAGQVLGS